MKNKCNHFMPAYEDKYGYVCSPSGLFHHPVGEDSCWIPAILAYGKCTICNNHYVKSYYCPKCHKTEYLK